MGSASEPPARRPGPPAPGAPEPPTTLVGNVSQPDGRLPSQAEAPGGRARLYVPPGTPRTAHSPARLGRGRDAGRQKGRRTDRARPAKRGPPGRGSGAAFFQQEAPQGSAGRYDRAGSGPVRGSGAERPRGRPNLARGRRTRCAQGGWEGQCGRPRAAVRGCGAGKGSPRSRARTLRSAGRRGGQGGASARACGSDSARSRGEPLRMPGGRARNEGRARPAAPQAQAPPPPAGLTAGTARPDPARRSPAARGGSGNGRTSLPAPPRPARGRWPTGCAAAGAQNDAAAARAALPSAGGTRGG